MGGSQSHEPDPNGLDPAFISTASDPYVRLLLEILDTKAVGGTHTIDDAHKETLRRVVGNLGNGSHFSAATLGVALVAAAHEGERRVTLVLLCDGTFAVVAGGEAKPGGCACGGRIAIQEGQPERHHVSKITAISCTPGVEGNVVLKVRMGYTVLELTVTDPAANAFVAQVCTLRTLATGQGVPAGAGAQPCSVPEGMRIEGLSTVGFMAPQTPDARAAIILGAMINKRTTEIPSQILAFVTELVKKGILDLKDADQSLMSPLAGQLQHGEPQVKVVKVSSNEQLEQFSSILAKAYLVAKISMKNARISAKIFDDFVDISVIQGGCSQCSELSLEGNPDLAASIGTKLSMWPRLPVLSLNFGYASFFPFIFIPEQELRTYHTEIEETCLLLSTPVYTNQGALIKLALDGCNLTFAAAASVVNSLTEFHLNSLCGLSMAEGIVGSPEDSGAFLTTLGELLVKSKMLSVLILSECNLDLQYFPTLAQAPLQVLHLTGNQITTSAASFNEFIRSVAPTLQLVSLRQLSVPGALSPTLCEDMAALSCVLDLSGMKSPVRDGLPVSLSAQTVVMRDLESAVQLANSALGGVGVGCQDLEIRTSVALQRNPMYQSTALKPALFSSPSLTSLSLAKCQLGERLSLVISDLDQTLTLSSLDVSNNGATGVIDALVKNLAGNRCLTSLNVAGNNPSYGEIIALAKFFGGVNKTSGVLWGNKTLVKLDIPSADFERDVSSALEPMVEMQRKGQQQMVAGQNTIKSAYRPDYRNPNQALKAQGIEVKVAGKKAMAAAEKQTAKLKAAVGHIVDAVKRNQNILSLKEQSKVKSTANKHAAKLTTKIDRQKEKYKKMVATNRAKRLAAWDQVRPGNYSSWRSTHGATFDAQAWTLLKAKLTAQHLDKISVRKLCAKTEAEIANEDRHKEEIEVNLKQLKQLLAIAATPQKPAYDPQIATVQVRGQYVLSPELQKNAGAWQNNKVVQRAQKKKFYKSRGSKKHWYRNSYDPHGYYWFAGYHLHGYKYRRSHSNAPGFHHGDYDSYSSDDYWSDWSSDDWNDDDGTYDDYPYAIEETVVDIDVDQEIDLETDALEPLDADAEDPDADDEDPDADAEDPDQILPSQVDEAEDADADAVEMYAGAGPQRWWKGDGGGSGSASQRASLLPPKRNLAKHKRSVDVWLDRFWQNETKAIFNEVVLGRREPECLPFKVQSFRCDATPLCKNAVSLVTQCSIDRLPQLEAQARAWNGPMSVAIFVQAPDVDLPAIAELHDQLISSCSCLSMEITVVHALPDDDQFSEYDRLYPINNLRNIATDHARTDLLFLLDVDFVPCRKLKKLISTELWTTDVAQRAQAGELTIVPAFEVTPVVAMPSEQVQVLAQVEAGTAQPFHVGRFPAGHQPTDFARWATATERYQVDYQECFEPYVIGSRALLPRYDERFKGYGMNKIQHLYACANRGLRFVVEPQVFVAAAEHERSEAWRIMYGPQTDGNTQQQKRRKQAKNNEHSTRVTLIWGRFKEELANSSQQTAAGGMMPIDSEHVLQRRRLCSAKVDAAAMRVAAATRRHCGTTSSKALSTTSSNKRWNVEKMANIVECMSSVTV